MTLRRILIIAGVALAGLAGAGYWAYLSYRIYLPGIIGSMRDPLGPHRAVTWEAGPASPERPPAERPPNIIVIVADDLGYNDITLHGGLAGGSVPTPHIDSLARDGARFLKGYAANATCSPSRAAIMTGRYPIRFGFEFTSAPVLFSRFIFEFFEEKAAGDVRPIYHAERESTVPPLEDLGLPQSEITIAELLKARGYRTLQIGKWHLGDAPALRPEAQGFDESLGFTQGAALFAPIEDPQTVNSMQDFDPIDQFLWANLRFAVKEDGGESFPPDIYMTDYFAREAAAAITANRNRPFFLYLSFNAPHTPLQAAKADYDALSHIADHRLRVYAAMIRALDRGVGTVLSALAENGLEENTLVIFTSDNGGANYVGLQGLNAPFRGWKATFFEGGIRVPFLVKWPRRIAPGTVLEGPAIGMDIYATAAMAGGAALPQDRVIDGRDLLPFAAGHAQGPVHERLFWRSGDYRVVQARGLKLQTAKRPDKIWLFDLQSDPTEQRNIAGEASEAIAELRALLDEYDAIAAAPLWPALIEGPIRIDVTLDQPAKPDDEYIYWAN